MIFSPASGGSVNPRRVIIVVNIQGIMRLNPSKINFAIRHHCSSQVAVRSLGYWTVIVKLFQPVAIVRKRIVVGDDYQSAPIRV